MAIGASALTQRRSARIIIPSRLNRIDPSVAHHCGSGGAPRGCPRRDRHAGGSASGRRQIRLLFQDGEVTGILDWGGLLITDPAFDVANTRMLLTIPGKHLTDDFRELGAGVDSSEWDSELSTERYLAAYRTIRPLGHNESGLLRGPAMRDGSGTGLSWGEKLSASARRE